MPESSIRQYAKIKSFVASSEPDDYVRLDDLQNSFNEIATELPFDPEKDWYVRASHYAAAVEGQGRDLMGVLLGHGIGEMDTDALRHEACLEVGHKLSLRCHGGVLDPTGLCVGDWLDGIDLSAVPAHAGGTAGQPWVPEYKNNRIVLSGLDTYKMVSEYTSSRNTKSHILFTFRNCPLRHSMNPTQTNAGGYPASELRVLLEGANGDGTGDMAGVPTAAFLNALKAQLGDILYTLVMRYESLYLRYTLWPPSEFELQGTFMEESPFAVQIPIYQDGLTYRTKPYNGAYQQIWTSTPLTSNSSMFMNINSVGCLSNNNANQVYGVSPCFCITGEEED